jgi:hypothetical protein
VDSFDKEYVTAYGKALTAPLVEVCLLSPLLEVTLM